MSPYYDFACDYCLFESEIELPMTHSFELDCPRCAEPLRKIITPAPVHFKGRGFYSTDK